MKTQKSQFNKLLLRYNKYLRKLGRLKITGRNLHRQSILHRHLERLRTKLKGLYISIKGATAIASVSAFCMMAMPEAQAQASYAAVQNNPFSLTNAGYYIDPSFADLDNDGDLDLMLGEGNGNFLYFENTGTASSPAFASASPNPFSLTGIGESSAPTFADLDGDGDLDLIAGEYDGTFNYFENTGTASNPAFAAVVENAFSLPDIGYYSNPTFADLDDDGDLDLIAGEGNGNFKYFENTGTASNPNFANVQNNPFALTDIGFFSNPSLADLDGDGDLDLLTGERYGNFRYFENTGTASNPAFATVQENLFSLVDIGQRSAPAFVDLDDDGDLDLMVGEYYGNFKYFENISGTGSSNNAPTVANPIANQSIDEDATLNFQFAENTFADEDAGDALTYTATLADGIALPLWLTFTANTRTFEGTPSSEDVGTITIKVTATDSGDGNLNVSDEFDLTVNMILSTNSNIVHNGMTVYANARGLNVRLEDVLSNATVSIYDLRGTLIKQVKDVNFKGSVWNTTFDKQGLFVITVLSENQLYVNKFMK